jgi:hypothetical protein
VKTYPDFYSKLGDMPRRFESRFKNNIFQTTSKLALHKNGPYSMSIRIHNKLPNEIKNELNNNKFLTSLKEFLVNKAFYSVSEYLAYKNNN